MRAPRSRPGTSEPLVPGLLWVLAWVGYPVVGAMIVTRRRDNRIGWLLIAIGFAVAVLVGTDGYSRAAPIIGIPGAEWAAWVSGTAGPGVIPLVALLMAAAARPLFRRVRTVVDRRFNRTSYDAGRIVGSLTSSLRDEVDPESVGDALVASVHRSLQPATVWAWTADGEVSPRRAQV